VERLVERGELARRRDTLHHKGRESPHRRVDIRSAGGRTFVIVIGDTGELLGTVDESRAFAQVHPGAIYLHQGEQFEVVELDLVAGVAVVRSVDPDFYTQSRDTTDIDIGEVLEQTTTAGGVPMSYGTVHVSNQVVGFARKLVATGEILDVVPLALPPQRLETRGVWWAIPQVVIDRSALEVPANGATEP